MFFYLPLALLVYAWVGYPALLWVVRALRGAVPSPAAPPKPLPSLTVMVTVHNEERVIRKRLENLARLKYDGPLDFLIVSDGSTDQTEQIVQEFVQRDKRFRLFRTEHLGKSAGQNAAMAEVAADLVVMSDAECLFARDYLEATARHFTDPQVGCVTGEPLVVTRDGELADSVQLYWRFERALRRLESDLGVLATAAGQCMAVRRAAFKPFEPVYGDDCVIPLDMALAGLRTVYATDAIAHDTMPDTLETEISTRDRMTSRNLIGTLSRRALLNPLRHPCIAWALVSHKLLRWFTPVFMLWWLTASLVMAPLGALYLVALLSQLVFYAMAVAGWLGQRVGRKPWPLTAPAFSFVVANVGFARGLAGAAGGRRITAYR